MCLYPKLINNKKYTANKKNRGVIPPIKDKRVLKVAVGCGKCYECVKQKKRQWQVRLLEEIKNDNKAKFVTLTFEPNSLKEITREIKGLSGYELDNEIATLAIRRFLERWRKDNKKSLKHWFTTELGTEKTEHLHLHGIIWTEKENEYIQKKWAYGNIYVGYSMNENVINYIVKYVSKTDFKHKEYKPKILTSAGIGKSYLNSENAKTNKYKGNETKSYYKTRTGHKIALPIYYKNNIYTDEERERLWLQLLDKQERWVWGEKIDISKGEEQYYKTLKYYQKKNKELGYQDDKINWERKRYENERRKLKIKEKIARAK